jgi:hypothetical protein
MKARDGSDRYKLIPLFRSSVAQHQLIVLISTVPVCQGPFRALKALSALDV